MNPWRTSERLITNDLRGFVEPVAFWFLFDSAPIVIGLALQAVFDRLEDPVGLNLTTALVFFVAASLARSVTLLLAEVRYNRMWVSMLTLQHRNALSWLVRSAGHRGELPDSPGDATGRLHDDPAEIVFFVDNIVGAVSNGVFAVLAVAIMSRISPAATVVVVLPLVGVVLATQLLTPRIIAHREADREAATRLQAFIGELYGGVLAVKVARAEQEMLARFDGLGEERRRAALRDRLLTDFLETFNGSTVDLAIGLMLLIIAWRSTPGEFTLGDLALFVTYLQRLGNFPRFLGRLGFRARQTAVSIRRVHELVPASEAGAVHAHRHAHLRDEDEIELPRATTVAAPPLERLEVSGLRCVHPNGTGLHDATFALDRGTFAVVTGPIGAGKTTLLRALLGLTRDVEGEVRWNGHVVTDPAAFFVPDRCAYLSQVPRLFSEPLEDNIRLGAGVDQTAVAHAIRTAAFEHDLARMPQGLATVLGPRGTRLSGGQIQRAAAARAFLRKPELLVIDDLSSALDTRTEREMWDRLTNASERDTTFLLVSNRRTALERADHVILLEAGRVTATGRFEELVASSPWLRTAHGRPEPGGHASPLPPRLL